VLAVVHAVIAVSVVAAFVSAPQAQAGIFRAGVTGVAILFVVIAIAMLRTRKAISVA